MRHLFVINPAAEKIKGRTDKAVAEINNFFRGWPNIKYDIHITRWPRDAMGFTRRYVLDARGESVRVHSVGGAETLFGITNAVIDLPNVQIAAHSAGRDNNFQKYFGKDSLHLFASLENQVFSEAIDIDVIRCGHIYGISYILIGLETKATVDGDAMIEKTHLPPDICYIGSALSKIVKGNYSQKYKLKLDGQDFDGDYVTMMIANQPWYGKNLSPAIDARPNDGILDFYIIRDLTRLRLLTATNAYLSGKYMKYPDRCLHYAGRKAVISSDEVVHLSIDGETFYSNNIEIEIIPAAIKFVCPNGIDTSVIHKYYEKSNVKLKRERRF